jgi:Family of unknown function (DUF5989)
MGMLKIMKRFKSVVALLGEFWAFMRMGKKWWLGPLLVILILMGLLIVLTEGSALAPFIYALF